MEKRWRGGKAWGQSWGARRGAERRLPSRLAAAAGAGGGGAPRPPRPVPSRPAPLLSAPRGAEGRAPGSPGPQGSAPSSPHGSPSPHQGAGGVRRDAGVTASRRGGGAVGGRFRVWGAQGGVLGLTCELRGAGGKWRLSFSSKEVSSLFVSLFGTSLPKSAAT